MLTNNKQINYIILLLSVIGIGLFLYRWLILDVPLTPVHDKFSWQIEAQISYRASNPPIKIRLSIPGRQANYTILNENFISRNYGVLTEESDNNRFVIWSRRHVRGRDTLYYRLSVKQHTPRDINYDEYKPSENVVHKISEADKAAAQQLIAEAQAKSADIASFAGHLLVMLRQNNNQNAAILLGNNKSSARVVEVATKLLTIAQIPALPLKGIRLSNKRNSDFIPWLTIKDKNTWRFFDPLTGNEHLPNDYLIWHVGNQPIYNIEGGRQVKFTIAKSQILNSAAATLNNNTAESRLLEFSLSSLPLPVQQIYRILLTIPLGALIILIFRNFIGLNTFGTFMPVLVALSFLEMQLAWGLSLYVIIITFGLMMRFYLEKLHLLLVPRLAAVLVLVVLLMSAIGIITHKLGFNGGASAALFPLVILTMTIERMCNLWDEQGASDAVRTGINSLIVAVICYLIMKQQIIQYVLFNFPELSLLLLAVILALGQYRGYRLTELKRFANFVNKPTS
ncbi:MAG: inactive transglutaminase family protein [Gammaproteobacteria bacterium]